jgi:hypothetical protein
MRGHPLVPPTSSMATTLTVRGPVPGSLTDTIRTRFDRVSLDTVLVVDDVDQAAVRALLTLLWDAGHEVIGLSQS